MTDPFPIPPPVSFKTYPRLVSVWLLVSVFIFKYGCVPSQLKLIHRNEKLTTAKRKLVKVQNGEKKDRDLSLTLIVRQPQLPITNWPETMLVCKFSLITFYYSFISYPLNKFSSIFFHISPQSLIMFSLLYYLWGKTTCKVGLIYDKRKANSRILLVNSKRGSVCYNAV